jgi:hypothetical protein
VWRSQQTSQGCHNPLIDDRKILEHQSGQVEQCGWNPITGWIPAVISHFASTVGQLIPVFRDQFRPNEFIVVTQRL